MLRHRVNATRSNVSSHLLAIGLGLALAVTAVTTLHSATKSSYPAGRIVIGAAVVDDILAMLVVAVAAAAVAGDIDPLRLAGLVVVAVGFVALVGLGGTQLLRRRRSLLTDPEFAETPFLPGMIIMLGLAALAAWVGLAAIIGAFLAGMVVGESSERHALEAEVAPVAAFFTPFFFGFIGAQVDLGGLANAEALLLLAGCAGADRRCCRTAHAAPPASGGPAAICARDSGCADRRSEAAGRGDLA